jgi:hypothetical protein
MPQWILIALLVLAAISTASSSYTAFKLYQMTDAKVVPTKTKR